MIFFALSYSSPRRKTDAYDFFFVCVGGGLCFEVLWPKGPSTEVFRYFQKSIHKTFLIFCLRLQQHKGLKLNKTICSKIGLGFLSFSEKSFYINFADLCLKIGLELTQIVFFRNNLAFWFLDKNFPNSSF